MDKTTQKSQHLKPHRKKRRSILNYFSASKDGVITGAADNDPAGIATFAQVGATTGFSLVWLLAVITPLVIAIEEMSAIRKHLAFYQFTICREQCCLIARGT